MTTADDFRRLALGLDGAEERSHMGAPDFRVGDRIFATLASLSDGYGNLMLTPEAQAMFVSEAPDVVRPIAGGLGKDGHDACRPGGGRRTDARRSPPHGLEAAGRQEHANEPSQATATRYTALVISNATRGPWPGAAKES